jgi:hypothetical protein
LPGVRTVVVFGALIVVYCDCSMAFDDDVEMVVVSISFVTAHVVWPVRTTDLAGHAAHDTRSVVEND